MNKEEIKKPDIIFERIFNLGRSRQKGSKEKAYKEFNEAGYTRTDDRKELNPIDEGEAEKVGIEIARTLPQADKRYRESGRWGMEEVKDDIYDIIQNKGKYSISRHDPVIDMLAEHATRTTGKELDEGALKQCLDETFKKTWGAKSKPTSGIKAMLLESILQRFKAPVREIDESMIKEFDRSLDNDLFRDSRGYLDPIAIRDFLRQYTKPKEKE